MNSGECCARRWWDGQPVRFRWHDGLVGELVSASSSSRPEAWLAPPLVDLQVNGFGGIDFQQDHLEAAQLRQAMHALATAGCGRCLVTLITDDWSRMLARLAHLRRLRTASAELGRAIAGWHLEGPFLSPEPGFHGAHDPRWMVNPTPAHLRELRAATGDDPVLLTLAPERPGAIAAIRLATELGMRVSLGHTNAPATTLQQAIAAGARGFTHLGNACPQQLDRHDNILWRVFDELELTVSLIPDGCHVSPPLFRLVHRLLGEARIYYTTDAMAAAGAPPGRYPLGSLHLEVGEDGIVRQPGHTNFAGSALRPIEGVWRAARMRGCSWREAWANFSLRPAQLMGWPEPMHPGASADFCLLQTDAEGQLTGLQLFRAGQQIV